MSSVLQILFGLLVLGLPMIMAGALVLTLATSVALVPLVMPLTCLLVVGAVGVSWLRRRRNRQDGHVA